MASVQAKAAAWAALEALFNQTRSQLEAAGWDEDEVTKLAKAKYTTVENLQNAREASLIRIGLARALVDKLVKATGAVSAGQAGGAGSADVLLNIAQAAQSMQITARQLQASVQPVEVEVSTCSSWKANALLAACQISTGPTTGFPCCWRNVQPVPTASIQRMVWHNNQKDPNLPQAVARLQAWIGDDDRFVVVDVHLQKWLSLERGASRIKEGKTDLLVLDKALAQTLLREERANYDALLSGTADRTTVMKVALAIVLIFECKTTSALASSGGVLGCRSQCKVEFAAINLMCGWHELGWAEGAEATAWLGDVNLDQVLAVHTVPGYQLGTRTLHVMNTSSNVSAPGVVLAVFREALRRTMTARSAGPGAPALPAPPAAAPPGGGGAAGGHHPPPAAAPPDGGGAAGRHPAPAAAALRSPEAGASHAPMQADEMVHTGSMDCSLAACAHDSAAQLVLSTGVGGTSAGSGSGSSSSGMEDVTEVPCNYHEMVDFNVEFQERLEEVLSHPSMLQDLGVTRAELRSRVAGMDAWGAMMDVYRKLNLALPPEGVGTASEGPVL